MEEYLMNTSGKDKKTALLLSIFLGFFGVHHFYVGKVLKGLLFCLGTASLVFFWIFDIVRIASGKFKDKNGDVLRL